DRGQRNGGQRTEEQKTEDRRPPSAPVQSTESRQSVFRPLFSVLCLLLLCHHPAAVDKKRIFSDVLPWFLPGKRIRYLSDYNLLAMSGLVPRQGCRYLCTMLLPPRVMAAVAAVAFAAGSVLAGDKNP